MNHAHVRSRTKDIHVIVIYFTSSHTLYKSLMVAFLGAKHILLLTG